MLARKGVSKTVGIIIAIVVIVVLALLYSRLNGMFVKPNPEYDNFAKCLTDRGAIMYGLTTCPNCQDQKKMFGDSFKYINYVECSNDPSVCTQKGVTDVPIWSINGTLQKSAGEKTIQELSSLTGCEVS